jgi:hypothetical protein
LPEKSLHFGDSNTLKHEFDLFRSVPFPDEPLNDQLHDIFADLAELDGLVAGLVSSYLKGSVINPELLNVGNQLDHQIASYHPDSLEENDLLSQYREYKQRVDNLLNLLRCSLDSQHK